MERQWTIKNDHLNREDNKENAIEHAAMLEYTTSQDGDHGPLTHAATLEDTRRSWTAQLAIMSQSCCKAKATMGRSGHTTRHDDDH